MDFVALSGVIVAVGAAVITLVALGLQRRSHQHAEQQQFLDLMVRIREVAGENQVPPVGAVGPDGPLPPPGGGPTGPPAPGPGPDAIYTMAQHADRMLENKKSRVSADWLQHMTLAIAFTELWDLEAAEKYWTKAGGDPDRSIQAEIRFRTTKARFHVLRAESRDRQAFQDEMTAALARILRSEPSVIHHKRTALVHCEWYLSELLWERLEEAEPHRVEAWAAVDRITSTPQRNWTAWRLREMGVPEPGVPLPGPPGIPAPHWQPGPLGGSVPPPRGASGPVP